MLFRLQLRVAVALALPLVGVVACSDDDADRSESGYCTEVGIHLPELNEPDLSTEEAIERTLAKLDASQLSAPG